MADLSTFYDKMGGNTGVTGGMLPGGQPTTGGWTYAGAGGTASSGGSNPAGSAQDPFGYTMGSLLTPWTKQFQAPTAAPSSGGGGAPGPAPTAAPKFDFGQVSYNFRDPGQYQAGAAFQGPQAFTGTRVADAPQFQSGVGNFQYNPYAAGQFSLGDVMGGQGLPTFSGPNALSVDRFSGGTPFQAPTLPDDPSYQFRLKQGQEALETSAMSRGLLGGDTMRAIVDYGQNAASQEYGATYNRAFDLWNAQNNLALNTYDRNSQAGVLENQTAYGRASDAYNRGADTYFNAANLGLSAFQANEGARSNAQGMNAQYGLAANESAYNRSASEYDRTLANTRTANQENYQRNASEYQQNFANNRDVYQMNEGNRLNAYQADAASAAAMGNLGMNATFGAYDRNYQNYATGFNIDEQRRQQEAAMAAAGAAGGRADEQQQYNRALQQYQMEYDMFNQNQNNQFSRLYAMTALGQGSAAQMGGFGGQYAGNVNEANYGGANAAASGYMGAGNAAAGYGAAMGNMGAQLGGYIASYGGDPRRATQPGAGYGY
jgi:hypothetical protein